MPQHEVTIHQAQAVSAQNPLDRLQLPEPLLRLIEEDRVDWSGRTAFNPDGTVDIGNCPKGMHINLMAKPIPRMGPKSTARLLEAERLLDEAVRPIPHFDFMTRMGRLALILPLGAAMEEREYAALWEEYYADLKHLPAWILDESITRYRSKAANEWFPRPAQLLEPAKARLEQVQRIRYRVRVLLGRVREEQAARTAASERVASLSTLLRTIVAESAEEPVA